MIYIILHKFIQTNHLCVEPQNVSHFIFNLLLNKSQQNKAKIKFSTEKTAKELNFIRLSIFFFVFYREREEKGSRDFEAIALAHERKSLILINYLLDYCSMLPLKRSKKKTWL